MTCSHPRTPFGVLGVLGVIAAVGLGTAFPASAQEKVLNLYTARHYQTDEALYSGFTKKTGIRINRIEGGEDALFERIKPQLKAGVTAPRAFSDYEVMVDEADMPVGVTLMRMV